MSLPPRTVSSLSNEVLLVEAVWAQLNASFAFKGGETLVSLGCTASVFFSSAETKSALRFLSSASARAAGLADAD